MKNKINIFSNNKIKYFLNNIFLEYKLSFLNLGDIKNKISDSNANIILIEDQNDLSLINLDSLGTNSLILSRAKNTKLESYKKLKVLKTPVSIGQIKNTIESFIQNLKVHFHDIAIENERITNIKNNSYCYLTKIEAEILNYLIREKEVDKVKIKEKILKIKPNIQTNSLDSHLTRIRKKMSKISTTVKIQSKSEKLLIIN